MNRGLAFAAIAVLIAAAAAFGWWVASEAERRRQLAFGGRIYAERCSSCHGKNLEGQPDWQSPLPSGRLPAPPHDASGHTWHHSDRELFTITRDGMAAVVPDYESDMPVFVESLTDGEIRTVIEFIKSTWPERERAYQEARNR